MVACKADQPALTDAHAALDATCTGPYADKLVDSFPATLTNPQAALGAPDMMSVSLDANSVVTVAFVGLGGVTDASGNDLRIHATVAPGGSALVRVANADMSFRYTGTLDPTTTDFDIGVAMLTSILYVRVIDVSGAIQLDAFEAIHDMCR